MPCILSARVHHSLLTQTMAQKNLARGVAERHPFMPSPTGISVRVAEDLLVEAVLPFGVSRCE